MFQPLVYLIRNMGAIKNLRRRLKLNRGSLLSLLPLHLQYVLHYKTAHKHYCALLSPRTFNQKLFYKMIYDRRPLLATFADKLQAREYVRRRIGDEILVKMLLETDRPEEIQFNQLPEKFVAKANHGSGYVRIVNQRYDDESDVRRTCGEWLSRTYSDANHEWFYEGISPRIIIETFLDGGDGEPPSDYKFYVFNGKTFMIQVDSERFVEHRRDLFSRDWERLDVRYVYPAADCPILKPDCLPKMLEIAERLGSEVDFVRVDLYHVGDRIFFGELTNTPEGGGGKFEPPAFDAVLGRQWRIVGY
ncbi:MAG: ATP-grasp fold amidoligase family protein [Limisphaerales bacterium]